MSDQDNGQVSTLQRPTTNDPDAWKAYWKAQGWPWRTEPEIDEERQKYLAERRSIIPDIEKGIYPFRDIKLSRADVEWLLATHENGRGPVDWSDESQRERKGLDLRGTDLRMIDLSRLPLTCLLGGLNRDEWSHTTPRQREMAEVHLEQADISGSYLEGANLRRANLQGVNLYRANLEKADLLMAKLAGALLQGAYLNGVNLRRASLARTNLHDAHLAGAQLRQAFLNSETIFENVTLNDEKFGCALLADVRWNEVNLALVLWSEIKMLGNDYVAKQKRRDNKVKDHKLRIKEFDEAVRANRQLAVVLQVQGLNEDAARFAYCAQMLQRFILRRQKKFGQYLFSLFLDLLAGYGYRPGRSVIWYLVTHLRVCACLLCHWTSSILA